MRRHLLYMQDPENPILTRQNGYNMREVLRGHADDVVDFVSRQEVVLVLTVAVVVVDVTCTHEKVSARDVPGKSTPVRLQQPYYLCYCQPDPTWR